MTNRETPPSTEPSSAPHLGHTNHDNTPGKPPPTRACTNCARSKTKCEWLTDDGGCRRCSRAKLQCCLPDQNGPKRRRGKSTRVRTLEQKVDDIMSVLIATRSTAAGAPAMISSTSPTSSSPHSSSLNGTRSLEGFMSDPSPLSGPIDTQRQQQQQPYQSPQTQHQERQQMLYPHENYLDIACGMRVSLSEADVILREFKDNVAVGFPFCAFPGTNAVQMFDEQSLVLKTIIFVSRPAPMPQKLEMDLWFRRTFAERIVVRNEKSLELLQALVVYIARSEWKLCISAHNTSLLHLALGLVGDMGLNSPPSSQVVTISPVVDDTTSAGAIRGLGMGSIREHTNADKRAFLAVYYLADTIWTLFRRSEPPACTEYMMTCARDLAAANEVPSDMTMLQLIEMQAIVVGRYDVLHIRPVDSSAVAQLPLALVFSVTQQQLDFQAQRFPPRGALTYLIWAQYHSALVHLYEPAIRSSSASSLTYPRTRALWSCFENAKALIDLLMSLPADVFYALSVPAMSHFAVAHLSLTKLLFIEDKDWDSALVRQTADYLGIIDRLEQYFIAADEVWRDKCKAPPGSQGPFTSHPDRLKTARNWYTGRAGADPAAAAGGDGVMDAALTGWEGYEDATWQMLFDWTPSEAAMNSTL